MKKSIIFFCIINIFVLPTIAQNVHFSSSNIEAGIRRHLGIGETDNITVEQIDTITHMCLSGMSIHDIRDISLLSNIKYLDLSNNLIDNVFPLVTLDSLRYLNLSNNNLESINMLSFSYAKEMYVDVTFNYIKDFSLFNTITHCNFAIDGAGMQDDKYVPYFKVYQLFSEVDASNIPKVSYRGYTNMNADVTLQYASEKVPVSLDGDYNTIDIPNIPQSPTKVILSNGEVGETTYIVPVADYTAAAGESVFLETGLPEDYRLAFGYAMKGSVEIIGTTMKYTAPETAVPDVVNFCYYQGSTLKGFSRFYVNSGLEDGTVTNRDYKLTYMVDGEEYKTINYDYGSTITAESIPIMEGYTFSGWSEIPATMPAHDVTVKGSFSINSYTLTYMVDGTEYKTASLEYGSAITAESIPTMEGYTFSGWSEIPATMPSHDVTVTGSFSINSYTLTYMVDGTEYKTASLEYGSAITAETAPTMEGYTFSGWSDIPETMPAYDIVIIGSFTKNYELGDATGDGVVDISDYIGVANHILGIPQTGFNAEAADVNKDGVIDISDYIGVANIILTGKP